MYSIQSVSEKSRKHERSLTLCIKLRLLTGAQNAIGAVGQILCFQHYKVRAEGMGQEANSGVDSNRAVHMRCTEVKDAELVRVRIRLRRVLELVFENALGKRQGGGRKYDPTGLRDARKARTGNGSSVNDRHAIQSGENVCVEPAEACLSVCSGKRNRTGGSI